MVLTAAGASGLCADARLLVHPPDAPAKLLLPLADFRPSDFSY